MLSKHPTLSDDWVSALNALPAVVAVIDRRGHALFVNEWFWKTSGLPRESVLDEAYLKLIHGDDLPVLQAAFEENLPKRQTFSVELRVRVADGTYRWFQVRTHPIDGTDLFYTANWEIDAFKDVALRFDVLAEAIPVIVWTATPDGWIDWYNHRWYEYTGQTVEEAAGWGWQAAHHPDDFQEVMRRWPRSIATGEPFEMQFRLRGADGRFRWFLTRIHPFRGADGQIVRWYGSNVDIDDQVTAYARTQRVAATLQQAFLPSALPSSSSIQFDALYHPAESDALVGGDWYDAFALPNGDIVFSIGDVAGHGLAASTLVGRLRQAIITLAYEYDDPRDILDRLNRIVCRQEQDTMVTALVGKVCADGTHMRYANAGHVPPILASDRTEAASLPTGGIPLGIREDEEATAFDIAIEPNSLLVLFTDGLIEHSRNLFTAENRLLEAVREAAVLGAPWSADRVYRHVMGAHASHDDVAILMLRFGTNVGQKAEQTRKKMWRFHSSDARSAQQSRHELTAFLKHYARHEEDIFAAELILGELLANTVEHAPGLVEVEIDWTGTAPIARVVDTGPGITTGTPTTLLPDALEEDGRGLFLVRTLGSDVTIKSATGYGTQVEVTLPVR